MSCPKPRRMLRRDYHRIQCDIEEITFGGLPGRWDAGDYSDAMRKRGKKYSTKPHMRGIVLDGDDGGPIDAALLFELHGSRGSRWAKVHRLIVRSGMRRLGLGTELVRMVEGQIDDHAYCVVPEDNLPLQLLFRSCGWTAYPASNGDPHLFFKITKAQIDSRDREMEECRE